MEILDIMRYFAALALVLALIGGAGLAMRRYGVPGLTGTGRRLQILESLILGKTHRLCIIRCDAMEHVVVLGPAGATLVSTGPAKPLFVPTIVPASEPARPEGTAS